LRTNVPSSRSIKAGEVVDEGSTVLQEDLLPELELVVVG
jgi:hypothetical protein